LSRFFQRADLLALIPERAFSIMLGPTTPFVPSLFEWGINALGGSRITDPNLAVSCIRADLPFKYLKGVKSLIWTKEVNAS